MLEEVATPRHIPLGTLDQPGDQPGGLAVLVLGVGDGTDEVFLDECCVFLESLAQVRLQGVIQFGVVCCGRSQRRALDVMVGFSVERAVGVRLDKVFEGLSYRLAFLDDGEGWGCAVGLGSMFCE
jgi:hypothetical protein